MRTLWARAHSRWGAIANPHAKIFDSRSPTPGMTLATEWIFCSICFLSFICESTHKVWYKNLWNWHVNDIWPRPKVTILTLGWKCYLHFVLLVIPDDLICYITMFKKKLFDPLGTHPQCPKVPPLGHDPGDRIKSHLICFVSFICENTHKIWYKNLWNWHGNRNLMIFDLWPHPKVTSLTLGWVLAFCSACHPRRFDIPHDHVWEKKIFDPLGTPSTPKSHPWGQNENPVCYVLYLSFVRTHTKFGIKTFQIEFVVEIKWYLTFWPLPRSGAKKKFDVARPIHVSNSHTKFGWISSYGLGGDSITDRRTEAITISPSFFLKKLEKSPRKRGNISWLSIYLYFAFKKAETCIPLSCVLIFHSFMKSETCIGDSSRRNDHGPK